MKSFAILVCTIAFSACAHSTIEGSQIKDTQENRQVVTVLEQMQKAFEARDSDALAALASKKYFEDMGTAENADDFGYEELTHKVLPEALRLAQEFHLSMQIHDVVVDGDHAHADVRYSARAKLNFPSGTRWDSHQEFNRIELAREEGAWRIISGL